MKESTQKQQECTISEKFILIGNKDLKILQTDQVVRLSTRYRYVELLCESFTYLTSDSLMSFEKRLPNYFFRINHGTIINIYHIKDVKRGDSKCFVKLSNGEKHNISRRRIKKFIEYVIGNLV